MSSPSTIAIDGPAASGKTTLGRRLAAVLGYLFIDTGAMYRAVTLACLDQGMEVENEARVTEVAEAITIDLRPASIENGRTSDVLIDGHDVTWRIRTPEVDANVSLVSSYPGVRRAMTRRQRQIGRRGSVVMVGRDIGSVVLKEADLKVYLDASVEARAKRRYDESVARGNEVVYEEILMSMQARDEFDSTRDLAPLIVAPDAVVIDTTEMDPDQALQAVLDQIEQGERRNRGGVKPSKGEA